MAQDLKDAEPIHVGQVKGLAKYARVRESGGWLLRLEIGDVAIEGWGSTQEEAKFMLEETITQWLQNTSARPVIK